MKLPKLRYKGLKTVPRLAVCKHVARQIKMKSRSWILGNTKVSVGSHESLCIVFCIVWKYRLLLQHPRP